MMLKDEVQMLRRVPLFAGVAPAMLKLLAFTSDRVTFRPGEVMFRQGDLGDAAYVILAGEAEVLAETPAGPIRVAELGNNAIVGEIAILTDTARTATVKAMGQVETLRIRKEHFVKLLTDSPEMGLEVIRVLARRLSQTTGELSQERSRNARAQGG
jgi:CRP-like cAMP-binding protein